MYMRMGTDDRIKMIVYRDPFLTPDEIQRRIEEKGMQLSRYAIATIRRRFINEVRFLIGQGLLPADFLEHRRPRLRDNARSRRDDDGESPSPRTKPKRKPRRWRRPFEYATMTGGPPEYLPNGKRKPFKPWHFKG
jgi:hypothetical protein